MQSRLYHRFEERPASDSRSIIPLLRVARIVRPALRESNAGAGRGSAGIPEERAPSSAALASAGMPIDVPSAMVPTCAAVVSLGGKRKGSSAG